MQAGVPLDIRGQHRLRDVEGDHEVESLAEHRLLDDVALRAGQGDAEQQKGGADQPPLDHRPAGRLVAGDAPEHGGAGEGGPPAPQVGDQDADQEGGPAQRQGGQPESGGVAEHQNTLANTRPRRYISHNSRAKAGSKKSGNRSEYWTVRLTSIFPFSSLPMV